MQNRIIIIITDRKEAILPPIEAVLKADFRVKIISNSEPNILDLLLNNIFVVGFDHLDARKAKEISNLIELAPAPIFVLDNTAEDDNNKIIIQDLLGQLPKDANLIFNADSDLFNDVCGNQKVSKFTFGFRDGADFKASDPHINGSSNFKLNYSGKIIPIWQDKAGNDYVYGALLASCIGIISGINLVKISELLKGS